MGWVGVVAVTPYICSQDAEFCRQWKLVLEKGKLRVPLRCERGQVVRAKMYKGQIYIKYDAPNTYI